MRPKFTFVLTILLLAAAPGFAYTIYLKDGTRLIAKEKYTVEGDLAILFQPSGTRSSIPYASIDVERTDDANVDNLSSTAFVIEGGEAADLKKDTTPPPVQPRVQDLIKTDTAGIRSDRTAAAPPTLLPSAATRESAEKARAAASRSGGGRTPLSNTQLAVELRGFVTSRGVTAIEIFAGSSPTWPRLVYNTVSEGAVFKALVTGANALLHFRSTRPAEIEGLEIVCETPDGGSGGRFTLTPDKASELVSGKTEITRFYVENVLF